MPMTMHTRHYMLALVPILLVLGGCSGTGDYREGHRDPSGTFPVAPEIEPNVQFWTNVYGVWGRDRAALHDDKYMLVYEVLTLPSPVRGGAYTPGQKDLVEGRRASLQYRLKTIERKVASGESLSSEEETLRDKLVDIGGAGAVVGASERVRVQRGVRERFREGLEVSGRYDETFREIFRTNGLPQDLAYLPHVESSFNLNARSSVGAGGMWQFMPATGRLYMNVNHAVDERFDPIFAAQGAARYLSGAYDRLGSWPLAVTSYNHGVGGMQKAKAVYGNDFGAISRRYQGSAFGFSSRNFYAQFLAAREVAGNPGKYFPEGVRFEKPVATDKLVLRHSMPAHQVASHYGLSMHELAEMNPAWRKSAQQGASLPAGSTIWLPHGTRERVAGEPAPMPTLVAARVSERGSVASVSSYRAVTPAAKPAKAQTVASAKAQPTKAQTVAAAKSQPAKGQAVAAAKAQPAKAQKVAEAKKAPVKVHVVQPNETLYRVATQYDLSVDDLRRINGMPRNDNTIRPGQRLRVNI